MISTAIWESLDAQERKWLQEAADESSVYQRQLWAVKMKESIAKVIAAGVEIVEAYTRAFQKACAPIMDTLIGTPVEPWLLKIQAVK